MNSLNIKMIQQSDWITVVFFLIFGLLGVIKFIYKERLFELVILFFSKKYFIKYSKEIPLIVNGFNGLFFTLQSLIVSLLILSFFIFYKPEMVSGTGLLLFVKIGVLSGIYFGLRYFIGLTLSTLFEQRTTQQQISFAKISYLFSALLLILPFLLLLFFMKSHNLLLFQLTIFVFFILLIIRYVFVFKNNKNVVQGQWFNFFLYLCALEIAPLMLILKLTL